MVVVEAVHHARCALCLHADDFHRGLECLHGVGHAACQSAAADGHEYHVDVGVLVQNFHADRALSGNHHLVVKRMDERHVLFFVELSGLGIGIIVDAWHEADFSPHFSGGLHLADWGARGHADEGGNAVAAGCQGHALCVVASRTGNHAVCLLLVGELRDFETGAAHFKRASHLQVFRFEENIAVGVDFVCRYQLRFAYDVL